MAVSLICASVALALHRTNVPFSRSAIAYWNALAWLAVYVFLVYIISESPSLYAREQNCSHADSLTGHLVTQASGASRS